MKEEKLSIYVLTSNNERTIKESVRGSDEIVVKDHYGADRTQEICHRYTERLYQHDLPGFLMTASTMHYVFITYATLRELQRD